MPNPQLALFIKAELALGLGQRQYAELLGSSRRTIQRWSTSGPPSTALVELVPHVLAVNPALAAEIAASVGMTLESMGLVQPVVQAPAQPPAPPPPPPLPASVVNAVVCAAAEAMDLMPREVRPGLAAAFATAQEIGLSVDDVVRALRGKGTDVA